MKDLPDYSLRRHNTFGIEARCSRFLQYETVAEAQVVAQMLRESHTPYIIIGGGSNLLLTKDYEGIIVRSDILGIQLDGDRMTCGSGEVFDEMVESSLMAGLYGLENLSLIPGDVGASAVQNIGAYGVEAKDFIETIEAVEVQTGQLVTIPAQDCGYGYRESRFKHEWKNQYLITHVTYRLSTTFKPHLDYGNIRAELERKGIQTPTAQQLRATIIEIRQAKLPDPAVTGNAGSFFMNPIVAREKYEQLLAQYPQMPHYHVDDTHEKIPAGWLIEQCGFKGMVMNGVVGVHERQALVLVNHGGATGQDVVMLYQQIIKEVKSRFQIEIVPEVNII